METVIQFYNKGVKVERSFFTYDEELKTKLERIEFALERLYGKTGKWIKSIELNMAEERGWSVLGEEVVHKGFSMMIDEDRKELLVMFLEEMGKQ